MTETSSQYVNRIAKEYGLYVLDNRAIPSMFDGLKTSQRIALWLMRNKAGKIKTMALAGEMIASELYVHGDAAASDAISLLAAKWKNNRPLLEGIGGFGSKAEPNSIGAPRYTYVKRGKFSEGHLYVDMEILPMVENHDGSNHMPRTFLPVLPLVLLNGVKGMATGWSTNILPRGYEGLRKAVLEAVETGKVRTKLLPHYEGYDIDVIEDGPNRYAMSGKATIKNTTTVIVTELPPEVTMEAYRERLSALELEGKIVSFRELDRKTINVEVKFHRATLTKLNPDKLLDYLKLRTVITERIVVIGENGVRQYETAEALVEDWVKWRLGWYEARFAHLQSEAEREELFWRSFIACYEGSLTFKGVPEILHTIKNRKSLEEYVRDLIQCNHVEYREDIGDRLVGLPVYRWTQEEYERAKKEVGAAAVRAKEYEKRRKDPTFHRAEFKRNLLALKV